MLITGDCSNNILVVDPSDATRLIISITILANDDDDGLDLCHFCSFRLAALPNRAQLGLGPANRGRGLRSPGFRRPTGSAARSSADATDPADQ